MPTPAGTWHPILAAVEHTPGVWIMTGQYENRYGVIQFDGDQYLATTWAEDEAERVPIGTYTTLREAAAKVHDEHVRSHGVGPPPETMWKR